ncbi:hypothetical protein O181_016632 [Austropuccinia psidii MF-1]|uniref:Uncharacterized protein n=1 Tax=Austropuccinia psidii MF-1 TaxID=1389203 RepID=A0A9Q3C4E5_9BASI|nr:hypothetical protein [Austropuccinia psidii MF-1]
MPDWNIPFNMYIYACGDGLGEALHQVQSIDDKPTEGPIFYISRKIKPKKPDMVQAKWSAYFWYGHLRNYTIILMPLLRSQIAIQEYRGNMTIDHKAGNIHKNSDEPSRWALANTPDNPYYVPLESDTQIPIEGINITNIGT